MENEIKTVLDRLLFDVTETNVRHMDEFYNVTIDAGKEISRIPTTFIEYRVHLSIGHRFLYDDTSEHGELNFRISNAKKNILRFIFRDLDEYINQLKGAVYDGDRKRCFELLNSLEEFYSC